MTTAIPSSLGVIVSGSYRYQITPEDVLWLARAVHKEGGSNAATTWTYIQRQAAYRRSGSLASLVLAHSQPVNPIWRADGSKCRPGGPYHGSEYCTPTQLAARAANATRPWEQIPESVRAVVVRAATAAEPNPVPGSTDFAAPSVSRGFLERNPEASVVLRDGNWYIDEGRVEQPVIVEHQGRTSGSTAGAPGWVGPVLGGGAAFVLSLLAWLRWGR